MLTIFLTLIILIYLRSINNLFHLISNLVWIRRSSNVAKIDQPKTNFVVCIPAYKEESVILKTINHFLSLDYPADRLHIVIVTTQKEGSDNQGTAGVLKDYFAKANSRTRERLTLLHYPRKDGLMAHQINYAAKQLSSVLGNSYFAVYNADSLPDKQTFRYVDGTIKAYETRFGVLPAILQQSAVFDVARTPAQGTLSYLLGTGAAMHQTLWTLIHEISRLRIQSSRIPKLKKEPSLVNSLLYSRYAHSVGHGLFVHGAYYKTHQLPENVLNEDMPYGLLQSSLRTAISPLPVLEIAASPSRIKNVFKQKSVWYNPFFEYRTSLALILKHKQYVSKFEAVFLTIQAQISLLIWLFHSFILLSTLVLSILLGPLFITLWIGCLVLYWFVPAFITIIFLRNQRVPIRTSFASILVGTLYVCTHSLGPVIAVARWMIATLRHQRPLKTKTEHA
jgi:hypothetical protein